MQLINKELYTPNIDQQTCKCKESPNTVGIHAIHNKGLENKMYIKNEIERIFYRAKPVVTERVLMFVVYFIESPLEIEDQGP